MKAQIYFEQYDRETHKSLGFKFMAYIECGDRTWETALEYAFRRTQNIEGSWSRPEYIDNEFNPDYHEDVMPTDLMVIDGVEYGHRSSMVGDRFIFDGEAYEVAPFGFKQIEWPERFTKREVA